MQKHIFINAVGGLGDHITAEPVIRYMKEKLYPNDDLRIAAHWPRVFEHLGVPVYGHNTFTAPEGVEYTSMWTLSNEDSALWKSVCFLLCHMVDYHSMAMLMQMLPVKDKQMRLAVSIQEENSLKEKLGGVGPRTLVLVHAGKSAAAKTFPLMWWQETADAISKAGMRICLIGKSSSPVGGDITGIVPIVAPLNAVDMRDKLSLGELFALIKEAPVLLSNDSSPVQIAGAFDNYIAMVATIKPADLVFPYRNGSPWHKTKALYKKLLIDETPLDPLAPHAFSVDIEVPDWSAYLPEPDEVAKEVSLLFAKAQ